jgi:polyisoprenoid-binding protein YceI
MTTTTRLAAGTWTVDTARSRAEFTARGLGHTVRGGIPLTDGTVEVDADGSPIRFTARLAPARINTNNGRRDRDLRGRRFLKVEAHPGMEVSADRIEHSGAGWRAYATLRVAGGETVLRIDAVPAGPATSTRVRVTGTARLDLRTVGISVPGFMVRRWVELSINAELTRGVDHRALPVSEE